MKQVAHQKQMTGGDGVRIESRAKVPFQFSGTQLKKMPLPASYDEGLFAERLRKLGDNLHGLAQELEGYTAKSAIFHSLDEQVTLSELWDTCIQKRREIRTRMIVLQEELDFTVYVMWGFADDSTLGDIDCFFDTNVEAGMRPFEILSGTNDEDFAVPDGIPAEWPDKLSLLWQKRITAIQESKNLRLIEDAHYKRRWIGRQGLFNHAARHDELKNACRDWLLHRLEHPTYWAEAQGNTSLHSVARIADIARDDQHFIQVASSYRGRQDFDVFALITELVESESVPLLPILRYKSSGFRKRLNWENVWDLQRKQDAGNEVGKIKIPPKFTSGDFKKPEYWRLRGKLDVSKERWISFPHCETDGDPSLVVGWAGWNYLQRGTAVVAYYDARKKEGWTAERLTPLLAALEQLLPWIHQWHPEIDPEYNETAGTSFQTLLESEAQELGLTLEQIRSWTPPAKKKAAKKKAAKKPRKKPKSAEETEGE
jgi:hypothetical protein